MRNPELRDKSGLTEAEFLARYNAGDTIITIILISFRYFTLNFNFFDNLVN